MKTAMVEALAPLARQRQAEFDEQLRAWRHGAGADVHLWCGQGCGNCCALTVNATLPEALAVADSLDEGQRQRLDAAAEKIVTHAWACHDARSFLTGYQQAVGLCPFLDIQAACSIYAYRPLACRALLATRPPDWCGVNLAQLPEYERDAFLTSLDRDLVAFPTHYAAAPQGLAADFERALIIAMVRVVGFGLSGNLPLLVWLAGQPGFDEALTGGPAACLTFLDSHHADRPFLVQIDVP